MDLRSPVNIVTRYDIYPNLMEDFWFTNSAWFSRMRDRIVPFTGGAFTKSIFRFRPMIGGFYAMGATHDITKVKTIGEANFGMKFLQVSVPEHKEELQVFAKGENAVFSLLDEDLSNGLQTAEDIAAFAAWGEGQTDETNINGLAEMIGDGLLPSWNGYVATSYGGELRSNYGSALNGNIFWAGQPDGSTGEVNFPLINRAYYAARKGNIEPNLMVGNKSVISFIENKLEPQYRYSNEIRDPYWGGMGFKYKNCYVMVDEHAPSALDGLTDDENYNMGNYKTAAFVNPLAGATKNGFPTTATAANLTPGEVLFILNTDYMYLRLSDDPEYAFGFSGFMGVPDSEKVVGRIKAALNFEGIGSRYQSLIYGIGS